MTCVSLKTDQEIQNGLQSSYNIYVGHNFIDEALQKNDSHFSTQDDLNFTTSLP